MRTLFVPALIVLLYSCQSNRRIFRTDIKPISKNDTKSFYNTFYNQHSTFLKFHEHLIDPGYLTILGLLGVPSSSVSDTVSLFLNDGGLLQINYSDSSINKTLYLKGKYSRRGFYQYYVERKTFNIPVISLLYSKRNIYRLRFAFSTSGDLVIQTKYVWEEHVLVLGRFDRYKQVFYYKPKASM